MSQVFTIIHLQASFSDAIQVPQKFPKSFRYLYNIGTTYRRQHFWFHMIFVFIFKTRTRFGVHCILGNMYISFRYFLLVIQESICIWELLHESMLIDFYTCVCNFSPKTVPICYAISLLLNYFYILILFSVLSSYISTQVIFFHDDIL